MREVMQTSLRLPFELHERISKIAEKQGIPINALIVTVLWEYLKKEVAR
jgi:predicted DNA-binding protein